MPKEGEKKIKSEKRKPKVQKKKVSPKTKKEDGVEKDYSSSIEAGITNEKKPRTFNYVKKENQSAKRWLWTGIAIITIFMVVIWFLSIKLQIENYDKLQNNNDSLIEKTQENWDKIFEETKEKENLKQTIKNQIENILTKIEQASTSATSSEEIATTTEELSTSTEELSNPLEN